jgi:hypothetical protein
MSSVADRSRIFVLSVSPFVEAHQPLIGIEAPADAARRAPDSVSLSQKIFGTKPCPRDAATVAWLAGGQASASTLKAHGMGVSSQLERKGPGSPPFSRMGSRAQHLFG